MGLFVFGELDGATLLEKYQPSGTGALTIIKEMHTKRAKNCLGWDSEFS